MRRLALLALLWPSLAWGYGNKEYLPFTITPSESLNKHLMWVIDDSTQAVGGTVAKNCNLDQREMISGLRDQLDQAGIEVHVYTYSQLRANMRLWHDAGLPRASGGGGYAAAFLPEWVNDSDPGSRGVGGAAFFRADSSSVQIIHFGGGSSIGSGSEYLDNASDPNLRFGSCVGQGGGGQGMSITAGQWDSVAVVSSSPTDTLFYTRANQTVAYGLNRAPGIKEVIRLFRNPASQGDSISPTAWNGDPIRFAWRVRFTNQGIALHTTPWVDYILSGDPPSAGHNTMVSALAWATISRYVKLPRIKVACILQGLGSFGRDPFYSSRPGSSPGNYAWPRAGYTDSLVKDLKNTYHVNAITITTQPDSLSWLLSNYPAWNTAVRGWTWAKFSPNWTTFDSLSPARSPTGVLAVASTDTTNTYANSLRVGNRNDPTNGTVALKWGIPQSFAYQDSILNSLRLPISYVYCPMQRASITTVPIGWNDYTSTNVCPIDSFMTGMHNAGRDYIIGEMVLTPGDYLVQGSTNEHPARLTGQTIGKRWNINNNEDWRSNSSTGGVTIHFMASNTEDGSAVGSTPYNQYTSPSLMAGQNQYVSTVLGLYHQRYGMNQPAVQYGQSAVNAASGGFQSWSGPRQRTRCITFPLRIISNVPERGGLEYATWLTTYFKPIKALEAYVGHQLVEWVYPEEAYEAVP